VSFSRAAALAVAVSVPACAAPPRPAPAAPAVAPAFTDDAKPLLRYRSHRLALTLPLPDGRAWRIDDHSQPELVATHAATHSRVEVAVVRGDSLVGRTQCEALAHDLKLVPDEAALRVVDSEIAYTQGTFDTRVVVALAPGAGPDRPLGGYVMAFGGFLRKCYVFVYATEVGGAADEPALSARLAFARARILGGLELQAFDVIPRQSQGDGPGADGAAPGP
jgi:hypothetical protein